MSFDLDALLTIVFKMIVLISHFIIDEHDRDFEYWYSSRSMRSIFKSVRKNTLRNTSILTKSFCFIVSFDLTKTRMIASVIDSRLRTYLLNLNTLNAWSTIISMRSRFIFSKLYAMRYFLQLRVFVYCCQDFFYLSRCYVRRRYLVFVQIFLLLKWSEFAIVRLYVRLMRFRQWQCLWRSIM